MDTVAAVGEGVDAAVPGCTERRAVAQGRRRRAGRMRAGSAAGSDRACAARDAPMKG